ncbi:unnamed protein product [Musa hybrid cultivar]
MLQRTLISENKTGTGPASQNLQKIGSEEPENGLETMKAAREGILEGGGERRGALETEQEGKRQQSIIHVRLDHCRCIVVHIKFIGLKIEGRFKDNEGTSQKSQNIQHTSRSVFLPMPNCSCSGPIKAQAKLEEGLLAVLPASLHHLHRKRAKLRGWMRMSGRGLVSPEPTQGGAWILFGITFLHKRSMLGGGFLIRPLQSLS